MSPPQVTVAVAVALLSQSCTAALAAAPAPDADTPPLAVLLADVDALLALVHNLSTKLSLLLKPSAPAYTPAIPIIDDLTQRTAALAHCITLLRPSFHGSVLVKAVTDHLKDIIGALRALAQTFLDNPSNEYLIRTGALHDLITCARSPSGIPKDNQTAVYHAWKLDTESLEDSLQEIASMIKNAESNDPLDDFDDGWDEIGLGNTPRLDKDELDRAKNVHQLLRITTLFHKRIFLDLLPYPSSVSVSTFDSLLVQSTLLLSTSDDLVAALYTPQDTDCVRKGILELSRIATALQTQIAVPLSSINDLATQLDILTIQSSSATPTVKSPIKKRANKKWFDTCVDQIVRLCTNMCEPSINPNAAT